MLCSLWQLIYCWFFAEKVSGSTLPILFLVKVGELDVVMCVQVPTSGLGNLLLSWAYKSHLAKFMVPSWE